LVTQKAGKREQGVIIGLTQSLMSVAQITAPVVSGVLIDHRFLTTWGIWAGVLAGLALFFEPRSYPATQATL
jgi:MFS family permease